MAVPPIDGRRMNQHQRVAPPWPHPSQEQPQQPVGPSKAPIRTLQGSQLVVQGKHFEQEVSTSRQRESDRSEGANDVQHFAEHDHVPYQDQWFWPDVILATDSIRYCGVRTDDRASSRAYRAPLRRAINMAQ